MAKQPRNKANAKPITAHQLFPAVVALWFGALFGLGSLAVRPSLLEAAVIKSRVDLLISAAAPPLGITARILLALLLAAIGSTIGIAIARRLARPKLETRERKRNAFAADPEEVRLRRRDSHPDAPARRPISASDELAPDKPSFGGGVLASRRRALTVEHPVSDFVPHETAPLPGGDPQIFDIGQAGIADLSDATSGSLSDDAYDFQADRAESSAAAAEKADAIADGRQVFGHNPQPVQSPQPRQIFGQNIEEDHVSTDFVKAAGFQTTVFDVPESSPLFPQRGQQDQPEPGFAAPAAFVVPPAPVIEEYVIPESAALPPEPTPVEAQAAVEAAPVQQPDLPSPAGLPMTDLAARLAESMARRRAARGAAAPEPAPVPEVAASITSPPLELTIESEAPQGSAPALAAAMPPLPVEPAMVADFTPAQPEPEAQAAIPQALRPLDLEGFEEDDDGFASMLPPRHIAMPPVSVQPVAPWDAMPAAQLEDDAPSFEAGAAEPGVAEDNYASLLEVGIPPRTGFVRIDEPEAEPAAFEPVVIFPGQLARPASDGAETVPFRRFDAPSNAEQGQPTAASPQLPDVDRDEADRALRMALANLQRMSGAA